MSKPSENKYFQPPRVDILRIIIDEIGSWESTTELTDEEIYRLIDKLLEVKVKQSKKKR